MRMTSLLAAALAGVAALAAAPAAQANWITGMGTMPVFRSQAVCPDGMDFQYGNYVAADGAAAEMAVTVGRHSTPLARTVAPITLRDLGVWVVSPTGEYDPDPVVEPSDYSVPFAPFQINLSRETVPISSWPGKAGLLTHSARFNLAFNRWLAPGSRVHVAWNNWTPDWPSDTAWTFTVDSCDTRLG